MDALRLDNRIGRWLLGAGALGLALLGAVLTFRLGFAPLYPPDASPLLVRQVARMEAPTDPTALIPTLRAQPARTGEITTGYDRLPVWALVDLPSDRHSSAAIEFRSVFLDSVNAWVVAPDGSMLLHDASVRASIQRGPLSATVRGFRLHLDPDWPSGSSLLVRMNAVSRASIDAYLWDLDDLIRFEQVSVQRAGLLAGSLLALALASLVIAMLTRDFNYLLLAGLNLTSLGAAAFSAGLERAWVVAAPWLIDRQAHSLIYALHVLFNVALFRSMFREDIRQIAWTDRWTAWLMPMAVGLVVAAFVLPMSWFLFVLYVAMLVGAPVFGVAMIRIALERPTASSVIYFGAWIFAALCGIIEVLAAVGILGTRPFGLSMRIGSIGASIVVSIALAAQLLTDRRARRDAEANAVLAGQRLARHYQGVPVGLFSLDREGRVLGFNPGFARLLGLPFPPAEDHGLRWQTLFSGSTLAALAGAPSPTPTTGDGHRSLEGDLGDRRFRVEVRLDEGRIEGHIEDITARTEAERQLRRLAENDSLTGLLNRRGFEMRLQQWLDDPPAEGAGLAYIDFDRFKLVNDLFGHDAGDQVLRKSAERMQQALGEHSVLGRVGGDEFVALVAGSLSGEANRRCAALLSAIRDEPFSIDDKAFAIDASIGLVALDREIGKDDMVSAAERACADAKRQGGSRLRVAADPSGALHQERETRRIVSLLRESAPGQSLFWVAQPIAALSATESPIAFEALSRLRTRDGDIIYPARFIKAAERNGLVCVIDRWMLESLLEWLDRHGSRHPDLQYVSMNLSGSSLNDERFIADALAMLRASGPLAARLCIEITEGVALYDLANTRRVLDRFKAQAVRVALDDFGAGYTSFSYLRELPADLLKIDGSFTRSLGHDPVNVGITETIIALAHRLGMQSVAEWAEHAAIVATLRRLGADFAQGDAIGRPVRMAGA